MNIFDTLKKELAELAKKLTLLQKQYDANEKRIDRNLAVWGKCEDALASVYHHSKGGKKLLARLKRIKEKSKVLFKNRARLEKEMEKLNKAEQKGKAKAKTQGDKYLVNFFESQTQGQARLYRVSHKFHCLAEGKTK